MRGSLLGCNTHERYELIERSAPADREAHVCVLFAGVFVCVHSNCSVVGPAIGRRFDLDPRGETKITGAVAWRYRPKVFGHDAGEDEESVRFDLEVAPGVGILVAIR